MHQSSSSRLSLVALAFVAACFGAPSSASAQLNVGTVIDRSLRIASPPNATLPGAMPRGLPDSVTRPDGEAYPRLAQADCSGAAAQAAAETGGQVLSVQSRQQGGRTVCVVTLLVPGEGGGRPRKRTITIPQ